MARHARMVPPVENEIMAVFVEAEQEAPYIRLEEISGLTPLATLQAEMLDPLARELARHIREQIECDELIVGEDGVVCGKIEGNI
jgi:hypothetical protein